MDIIKLQTKWRQLLSVNARLKIMCKICSHMAKDHHYGYEYGEGDIVYCKNVSQTPKKQNTLFYPILP